MNNPILNNPYKEPAKHFFSDDDGKINYQRIIEGRRSFRTLINMTRNLHENQEPLFELKKNKQEEENIIDKLRQLVKEWRKNEYPNTTGITNKLLLFWFNNPERENKAKLFFAQQEAIETAIWLNEVAEKDNQGNFILQRIRTAQQNSISNKEDILPRIAFKMATGTGKTVVMAMLILYNLINRFHYKNDIRFADNFLVVAPGITIKNRLSVLIPDINSNKNDSTDYYHQRDLVPYDFEHILGTLAAKIVITNYHAFEPKSFQGNKVSVFDGKKNSLNSKEDISLTLKRLLGKFRKNSRLLIINDEAHHCYLPKANGKNNNEDGDNPKEENEKAAVWFSGLREINKKFQVQYVYDLSATPYYLKGSGYNEYSLFPWVVSDFSLIEAIESGLVKIPLLPEKDNTFNTDENILRNIYENIKKDLPKKGQRKIKSEANKEKKEIKEERPVLPVNLKTTLEMFHKNYVDYEKGVREKIEKETDLFSTPPVMIIVCNNTTVSKEVYKYISGFEYEDANGEIQVMRGAFETFSNYDFNNVLKKKIPTLLIDSNALENSEQISDDFKKIFVKEIDEFKREYAKTHGAGSTDNISDSDILREVVNTVGKPDKLGANIRCVVSVSMLTEGWDANTVTHIVGIRAFGSQLLCEQVAGRALRRMSYELTAYDKDGNPTNDKRKIAEEKFAPEFARIIGVPFSFLPNQGNVTPPPTPPVNYKMILPVNERKHLKIDFPNVEAYRIDYGNDDLKFDFKDIENFLIDTTEIVTSGTLASPFTPDEEKISVYDVLEKRDNEIIFYITKELIKRKLSEKQNDPKFALFNSAKKIVEFWYFNKTKVLNQKENYRKLIWFMQPNEVVEHISKGINPEKNNEEFVRPVLNHYNPIGSTDYVFGRTVKDVYSTEKSHINYVVRDSGWEAFAAQCFDSHSNVISYVKNSFLRFQIPYIDKKGKERQYIPDFILQCKTNNSDIINLIIEVSGYSTDKAEKKWYVQNKWLPAVNSIIEKFNFYKFYFIEIDESNIKDVNNVINHFLKNPILYYEAKNGEKNLS